MRRVWNSWSRSHSLISQGAAKSCLWSWIRFRIFLLSLWLVPLDFDLLAVRRISRVVTSIFASITKKYIYCIYKPEHTGNKNYRCGEGYGCDVIETLFCKQYLEGQVQKPDIHTRGLPQPSLCPSKGYSLQSLSLSKGRVQRLDVGFRSFTLCGNLFRTTV